MLLSGSGFYILLHLYLDYFSLISNSLEWAGLHLQSEKKKNEVHEDFPLYVLT